MADLQKFVQASNGAFKSDLMKSFMDNYRSDLTQSTSGPSFNQNITPTGAGIFSTQSTNTSTDVENTDNANILLQKNLTDNIQTSNVLQNEKNGNKDSNLNVNPTKTAAACPEQADSNANESEICKVLEEVQEAVTETQQMLVQQVMQATVDAHLATCINTHKAVAEATARFSANQVAGQLPDMSKLTLRATSMWEKMTEQMMPELGKAIKFCKMLPGFSELLAEDQMKLIKFASFEVMITRFSMLINHEKETMLDPSHKMICTRKVVLEMPMGKFLDGFFHVGSKFNPVGLTDGEIGLFTAILLFNPNRPGLKDSKLITKLQRIYQQAFFSQLKQNHSDPEDKFTKAISLIPMFNRINEEHTKALKSMKMQSPDSFDKQFTPLHNELYIQDQ